MIATTRLSKHYEALTAEERLPLIAAAAARGDEVERARLESSAPKERWEAGHHAHLADRLTFASACALIDLLTDALTVEGAVLAGRLSGDDAVRERWLREFDLVGLALVERLAGWRLFCERNGFDPETAFFEDDLPGWGLVLGMARVVEEMAARNEDGGLAGLRSRVEAAESSRLGRPVKVFTATDVADGYDAFYRTGRRFRKVT